MEIDKLYKRHYNGEVDLKPSVALENRETDNCCEYSSSHHKKRVEEYSPSIIFFHVFVQTSIFSFEFFVFQLIKV